jgi:D-sedoheptulose 7-phosphate isomerase
MKNTFHKNLAEHLELFSRIEPISDDIRIASDCIVTSLRAGQKLMLCGNGGSAADSQHIASESTGCDGFVD